MASNQKNVNAANAAQGASGSDNAALQNRINEVVREMQFLSQQNTAMFESFDEKLSNLKREFAYLNQQNLSVYNMTTDYVRDALAKSQAALEEKLAALQSELPALGAKKDDDEGAVLPSVEVVVDHDRIVDGIVARLRQRESKTAVAETAAKADDAAEEAPVIETVGMVHTDDSIDYDVLAGKIADNIPPVDYDYLACKIVNNMTAFDQQALAAEVAQKIADNVPQSAAETDVTADAVAESVVAKLQETPLRADSDTLADAVADKVVTGIAAMDADGFASLVADKVAATSVSSAAESESVVDTDAVVDGVIARLQEAPIEVDVDALASNLAERIEMPPLEVDFEELAANIAEKIDTSSMQINTEELAENVAGKIDLAPLALNTEELAESISAKIAVPTAELDYDMLAEKIMDALPEVDYEALAAPVTESVVAVLPKEAEPFDADALADAVAAKLQAQTAVTDMETAGVDTDALAEAIVAKLDLTVPEPVVDAEAVAEAVAAKVTVPEATVDTDALASKILENLPEVDYDALSAPVVAGVVAAMPHEQDADELAAKVSEKLDAIWAEQAERELNEENEGEEGAEGEEPDTIAEIAGMVAQAIDYDAVAEKLAEKLNGSEEDVEEYLSEHDIEVHDADDSARVISAVEENSGKTNALVEEVIELLKQKQFVAAAAAPAEEAPVAAEEEVSAEEAVEEPVQEVVDEPAEEPVQEVADESAEAPVQEVVDEPAEAEETAAEEEEPAEEEQTDAEREMSIAEAAAETEELRETAQEQGKTVRLKRSYECKLRQSDDDIKYYYSEIKNELLSYSRVKSSMSWNGDRFNLGRDTIAKININGKTLCVYLALNPDEYSITKYHHKYVGDVKAYESTPMQVKVKSNMGLKKAISLVFEMMENLKAQRKHRTPVDYAAEYTYKSDEELIAEGLIKASITEKKDLNSF